MPETTSKSLNLVFFILNIYINFIININIIYEPLIPYQSITINTIRLIPNNSQKIGVNKSFLILNRVIANTKKLIPINIQKKVSNVILFLIFYFIVHL